MASTSDAEPSNRSRRELPAHDRVDLITAARSSRDRVGRDLFRGRDRPTERWSRDRSRRQTRRAGSRTWSGHAGRKGQCRKRQTRPTSAATTRPRRVPSASLTRRPIFPAAAAMPNAMSAEGRHGKREQRRRHQCCPLCVDRIGKVRGEAALAQSNVVGHGVAIGEVAAVLQAEGDRLVGE